jgi:hypothetical protein
MIIRWARFPTPGVGFRADPLIMASDWAAVASIATSLTPAQMQQP